MVNINCKRELVYGDKGLDNEKSWTKLDCQYVNNKNIKNKHSADISNTQRTLEVHFIDI